MYIPPPAAYTNTKQNEVLTVDIKYLSNGQLSRKVVKNAACPRLMQIIILGIWNCYGIYTRFTTVWYASQICYWHNKVIN